MTITSKDTRQRLLDLWEKCPECRWRSMNWALVWEQDDQYWFLSHVSDRVKLDPIDESAAIDLACIAIVRWLINQDHRPQFYRTTDGENAFVIIAAGDYQSVAETFIDALISAVEAILKAEEQTS